MQSRKCLNVFSGWNYPLNYRIWFIWILTATQIWGLMGMTEQTQGAWWQSAWGLLMLCHMKCTDSVGHKGSWYRGKQWPVSLQLLQLSSWQWLDKRERNERGVKERCEESQGLFGLHRREGAGQNAVTQGSRQNWTGATGNNKPQ